MHPSPCLFVCTALLSQCLPSSLLLPPHLPHTLPTADEEVRAQLRRADADGNDSLDLAEWLKFSRVLANYSEEQFNALIDNYMKRLDEAAAKK